jgi:FdhD protein
MPSPLGPVPGLGYSDLVSERPFVRFADDGRAEEWARIATEVPVAFVYNNQPYVVVMASPADLEDLAAGFSVTEQIVESAAAISSVEVVRHSRGVELQISIDATSADRLAERRRGISARTGCGVCGIETIDEVLRAPRPVAKTASFPREALWRAAAQLETQQPVNHDTRSVHAAAFADATGSVIIAREDVGRHNALDKVIGAMVRTGIDPASGFLIVTSRASYELVQKTAVAGVPLLAAISRPTALAIELADQANVSLVGLVRGRSANVYSHHERLTSV